MNDHEANETAMKDRRVQGWKPMNFITFLYFEGVKDLQTRTMVWLISWMMTMEDEPTQCLR